MSDFLTALDSVNTQVSIQTLNPGGLFQVAAWPDKVASVADIVDAAGALSIMEIAPGRYLLETDKERQTELHEKLQGQLPQTLGTVTDLSCARTCFTVSGHGAAAVMAKGLPLDLHLEAFPVGKVLQSAIHEIAVVVRRTQADQFDVFVYKSFADSLLHWLHQAAGQ